MARRTATTTFGESSALDAGMQIATGEKIVYFTWRVRVNPLHLRGMLEKLDQGFDVVEISNADRSDYDETLVLDRVGNLDYAAAVADELGTEPAFRQMNRDLLLEVTVILGRDRASRYAPTTRGRVQ